MSKPIARFEFLQDGSVSLLIDRWEGGLKYFIDTSVPDPYKFVHEGQDNIKIIISLPFVNEVLQLAAMPYDLQQTNASKEEQEPIMFFDEEVVDDDDIRQNIEDLFRNNKKKFDNKAEDYRQQAKQVFGDDNSFNWKKTFDEKAKREGFKVVTPEEDSIYSVLYLTSDAPPEIVSLVYKHLAKKYHPDKNNQSRESLDKMQEINEAYQKIKNIQKHTSHG